MSELKGFWKQTAKSFILAFNDLGVSLVESAKAGADKAVEWARKDNPHYEAGKYETEGVEIPTPEDEPAEQTEQAETAESTEENAE